MIQSTDKDAQTGWNRQKLAHLIKVLASNKQGKAKMDLDESAIVEYAREREQWNLDSDLNIAPATPSTKKSIGCLGLVIRVVISLVILRAILEIVELLFI